MSTGSMDNRVATGESPAEADTLDSETWSGVGWDLRIEIGRGTLNKSRRKIRRGVRFQVFEYHGFLNGKRVLLETIRIEFRWSSKRVLDSIPYDMISLQ